MHTNPYPDDAPWPCFRGDAAQRGASLSYRPTETPWEVRHVATGNGVFSTPIIGPGEQLVVGSADRCVYRIDAQSGAVRWTVETGEIIDSAAAWGRDGTVYVPSGDGRIYALNGDTGAERWRFDAARRDAGFTPSSILWWEANVTLGPDGAVFAGSDDFYLYALNPTGGLRWATPTGLNVWSGLACGKDLVYASSFDMHVYACEQQRGRVRWRTPVRNFMAASPALTDDALYIGTFGGELFALDPRTGRTLSVLRLGGPIYASVAVAPDGRLYVGAGDGLLYAIDPTQHQVLWTYATSDPIRASASVGPDPTGQAPYLVYVGSGDGSIYAIDPDGRRRWSYDTATAGPGGNLNASIALGHHGLATASSGGDIVYVPYDAYQRDLPGFTRRPDDGLPADGRRWVRLGADGRPDPRARAWSPGQPVTLRLQARARGRSLSDEVVGPSLEVEAPGPWRAALNERGTQVVLTPQDLSACAGPLRVAARTRLGGVVEGEVPLEVHTRAHPLPADPRFRVTHLSVFAPTIIPSFDQIGLASLTIDVRIVEVTPDGRALGWGVQTFGLDPDGEVVGVTQPRHLYFAFDGSVRDGWLQLEAAPCAFEITAFPVPLRRLRLSGGFDARGLPSLGTSLEFEARLRSWRRALGLVLTMTRPPLRARDLPSALGFAARALPAGWWLLQRRAHAPWGLFNRRGVCNGAGTFRANPAPPSPPTPAQVTRIQRVGRRVIATLTDCTPQAHACPFGILITDPAGRPLPVDLTARTTIRRDRDGAPVAVELALPRRVRLRRGCRVRVLGGLEVLASGQL